MSITPGRAPRLPCLCLEGARPSGLGAFCRPRADVILKCDSCSHWLPASHPAGSTPLSCSACVPCCHRGISDCPLVGVWAVPLVAQGPYAASLLWATVPQCGGWRCAGPWRLLRRAGDNVPAAFSAEARGRGAGLGTGFGGSRPLLSCLTRLPVAHLSLADGTPGLVQGRGRPAPSLNHSPRRWAGGPQGLGTPAPPACGAEATWWCML